MREFCHTTSVTQTPSHVNSPILPDASTATSSALDAAPQSPALPDSGVEGASPVPASEASPVPEIGGRRDGTDPTRFGDWEKGGRCIDF